MNRKKHLPVLTAVTCLAASTAPSSGIVVMISDLTPGGSVLENFINGNFTNVTEIRHANYGNFGAAATQDALNGTGVHAGNGAAEVVIIGRSLSSGDYDAGDADGYNALTIPVVSFTSYTVRNVGNRMGWHASSTTTDQAIAGAESTVTAAGAAIFGLAAGPQDLLVASAAAADTFNGLGDGAGSLGGGDLLASVGGDILAAYWDAGDAPGDVTVAGVATFGGPRLLFNLDNDPNSGNNGVNDVANLSPDGRVALINALGATTPLNPVPEPSTGLLGLLGLGLLARRRR